MFSSTCGHWLPYWTAQMENTSIITVYIQHYVGLREWEHSFPAIINTKDSRDKIFWGHTSAHSEDALACLTTTHTSLGPWWAEETACAIGGGTVPNVLSEAQDGPSHLRHPPLSWSFLQGCKWEMVGRRQLTFIEHFLRAIFVLDVLHMLSM